MEKINTAALARILHEAGRGLSNLSSSAGCRMLVDNPLSPVLPQLSDSQNLCSIHRPFHARFGLTLLFSALPAMADIVPASAEFKPFVPAPKQIRRAEVIPAEEVRIGSLRPAEFRRVRSLNGTWKISGVQTFADPIPAPDAEELQIATPGFDDSKFSDIAVPGNFFNMFRVQSRKKPYARAWYRKEFRLSPDDLKNRRLILKFERVAYEMELWLNGKKIGGHHGQYTSFEMDATSAARPGRNVLALRVLTDNGPQFGTGPAYHTYGSQWWMGLIAGGITGSVELSLEPEIRIAKALITPDMEKRRIHIAYTIENNTGRTVSLKLKNRITSAMKRSAGKEIGSGAEVLELSPGRNAGNVEIPLEDPVPWRIGKPYLYFATLILERDGKTVDAESFRFGYRDFRIRNGRFEFNGEPVFLFSANISSHHFENVPWSEKLDALAEKYLLGFLNRGYFILRTSHMPIRDRVLELADECGTLIAAEWSWAFTAQIDHKKWNSHAEREVTEFVEDSYNHPSVVLWSMGNEVSHILDPAIADRFSELVRLVRRLDRSGRPASAFSGSASVFNYGTRRLDTDLVDSHSYTGLSAQWTSMRGELETIHRKLLDIYAPGRDRLPVPWVGWEHIGFSWGFRYDKAFRPGDRGAYEKYAEKIASSTWGNPQGIGFSGCIGLAAALDPERGAAYGMRKYMPRIFSTILLDGRMSGYAPWNPAPDMDFITQTSQKIFPVLVSGAGLFPGNLFSGEHSEWNMAVVNVSGKAVSGLTLELSLADLDGQTVPAGSFKVPEVNSFSKYMRPVRLEFPEGITGHRQLRLILRDGSGGEAARNYCNIFLADSSVRERKINPVRRVFLLDTGHAGNVAATRALLERHGIAVKTVSPKTPLNGGDALIVPAELVPGDPVDLGMTPEMERFLKAGGVMLILEQQNVNSRFPDGSGIIPGGMSFIDLVSPDHPVFNGLDQRNFDTWNNEKQNGFLLTHSFVSFMRGTIAAKGVSGLGSRDLRSAVTESSLGKGRIIASQLKAAGLHDSDSSAAVYFANLLRYALESRAFRVKTHPFSMNRSDGYVTAKDRCRVIDLAPYVTTSFRDEKDGDRQGGWTDQGENDFRHVQTGMVTAAGVPFRIIDPEKNGGKSCIVLCGTARPYFPEAVRGIRADGFFSRLFFLHTTAWGNNGICAYYRIRYADGSHVDYPMAGQENVADWWFAWGLPKAKLGIQGNGRRSGTTFVAEWENPHPEKRLAGIDFLSMRAYNKENIDYLPSKESVPILLAITGEECSASPVRIPGKGVKISAIGSYHLPDKGELRYDEKRREIFYRFPRFEKRGESREPGFICFFKKGMSPDEYRTLTLEARATKPLAVKIILPCSDWKHADRMELVLPGGKQFRRYRIHLDAKKNRYRPECRLRGELLVQALGKDSEGVELEIRNMTIQ